MVTTEERRKRQKRQERQKAKKMEATRNPCLHREPPPGIATHLLCTAASAAFPYTGYPNACSAVETGCEQGRKERNKAPGRWPMLNLRHHHTIIPSFLPSFLPSFHCLMLEAIGMKQMVSCHPLSRGMRRTLAPRFCQGEELLGSMGVYVCIQEHHQGEAWALCMAR